MIDMNFFEPLPPRRPFDFSAYLLPQGVADLLWDDPNIRAAWRAGVEAASKLAHEGTGAKPLTCRRCGEALLNGIVTIRDGRLDHASPLCEDCIAELGDDEPEDAA